MLLRQVIIDLVLSPAKTGSTDNYKRRRALLLALDCSLAFGVRNGGIFGGGLFVTATRNTGHTIVGVGVQKKRDRVAWRLTGVVIGEMFDADKAIIGPLL